jgi:hypothetical protein
MLVAAAVCPCPPLLVPELAAGAAGELDGARAACADALGVLTAARPDRLVVVGPADLPGRGPFAAGARGSFRGFGVDVEVTLGRGEPTGRTLPPALAVAAWLLTRGGWAAAPVEALGVGEPLEPARCAAAGRELAAGAGRLALLVMGDGSACRSARAPGAFDERAAAFDDAAARALGDADTEGLAGLDAELAEELMAAGRSSWQVLGGAGEDAGLGGRLLYHEAPYGVGYFVASWS